MRFAVVTLSLLTCAAPLLAEDIQPDPPAEEGEIDRGFSLLEEGANLFLRGLMEEVEPQMKDLSTDLGQALDTMKPALEDLLARIDDLANYQAPEVLPNGDIIMRRKPDAPTWTLPEPGAVAPAIDL